MSAAQLQEAYRLIKEGDKATALQILQPICQADPHNGDAWWLLANALSNPAQVEHALQQVLLIDPFHVKAQQKLDRLRAGIQTGVHSKLTTQTLMRQKTAPPKNNSTALLVIGVIVIIAIVGGLVFVLMNQKKNSTTSAELTAPTALPTTNAASGSSITATPLPSQTPRPTLTPITDLPPTWTPAASVNSAAPVIDRGVLPRFEKAACLMELPDAVGNEVECGYLVVPTDWANPTGESLKVAVSIVHSYYPDKKPDPIIFLQGGPGGSSTDTFTYPMLTYLGEYFREARDVIMIDQRGTIYSQPDLVCDETTQSQLDAFKEKFSPEQDNAVEASAAIACHDLWTQRGVKLANFNSFNNAADVAALRDVLGYDQYNLYGVSYGSLLALHVMQYHPEGLRSVIIDAVVPPQINYLAAMPTSAEDVFDRFFAECANDFECNGNFPNLENVYADLVARLNANPISISIEHPVTGAVYDQVYITGDRLTDIIFSSMYSSGMIPFIPRLIYDINNGNNVLLKKSFRKVTFDSSVSEVVFYSVNCSEEGVFDPALIQTTGVRDYLARNFDAKVMGFLATCEGWGLNPPDATINQPVVSDVPILVYAGEFDPIIGKDWALQAAQTLSNSHVYIFPALGHGSAFDDFCPLSIMLEFINDPSTEPPPDCIRDMEVFWGPPTAGIYQDPQGRFTVGVPDGWTTDNVGDYGQFVNTETGSEMYVTAVDSRDLSTGIATAIQQIFPAYTGEFVGTERLDISGDEWITYIYDDGQLYMLATGIQDGGITYVHLALSEDYYNIIYDNALYEMLLGFDYQE